MSVLEHDVFAPPPRLDFWMTDNVELRKRLFKPACNAKRQYRSKAAANHARIEADAKNNKLNDMIPYQCEVCGKWHLRSVVRVKKG